MGQRWGGWRRWLVMFASGAAMLPAGTSAQEATPIAARDVPSASECRVAARPLDAFQALATPVPDQPEPTLPSGAPMELPAGEPLDEATLAAVSTTAREVIACSNAGERLRALALFSDNFLRQSFGQLGVFPPELYQRLATPQPLAVEQQVALVEVRDGRLLPDGRVGLVVVVDDPAAPSGERRSASFLYFVFQGDRWLIDGAIENIAPGAAETPAP